MTRLSDDDRARIRTAFSSRIVAMEIGAEVAALAGITFADMIGPRRDAEYALARQIAWYLAEQAGVPRSRIADVYKRDVSTVRSGIEREKARR